ncbi:MAG: group II intron reverse transcriptase domain-containing protein [Deltaproteobacteria bacterium]|nr:group II intron reverse transcriptase domain-containing protein [Deltaproteobacteria bacterium]
MNRVGHLFERVAEFHALCAAARRAAKGKRISHEAGEFLLNLENEVLEIERELLDGSYQPASYRTFHITDPKPRTISAAAFRDRVVHHALCAALEPTLERYAISDSYACRKGKGALAAVKRVQSFSRRFSHFLKLDVLRFFETACHDVLKSRLRRVIKDRRCLWLCDQFIDAGAPGSPPGKGLPIGNLTSQHFANFYLGELDHYVKEELRIKGYVRYMDDFLLFNSRREVLSEVYRNVKHFLESNIALKLKDSATIVGSVSVGVPYLGFRIWPRIIRLDAYRASRFRAKVRARVHQWQRTDMDDDSWSRSVTSLSGWAEQADTLSFRRSFLDRLRDNGMLPD